VYTPTIFNLVLGDSASAKRILSMGEEGDCDDFPSAFICLPAFSRNYKHADEHSL